MSAPTPPTLTTAFAPPERAPRDTLLDDMHYFQSLPLVRDLLGAAPEVFLILNEQRQAVYANQSLLDTLRITVDEFQDGLRPGEMLKCTHAHATPGGCGTTEFCRTCGAVRAILTALGGRRDVQECRILREDGSALDLEVTATPLTTRNRRFTAFSARDISHEKRRHVLERLFFHDILNTASGVVGFAELLNTASAEEIGVYLPHLYQLSLRLIDEIRSQKALLDAENDSLDVVLSEVDSVALLAQVAEEYAHPDLSRGRRVALDSQSESVDMITSPVLVRRVLANMARNALEATRPGDTITLRCRKVDGGVEFAVHNPGVMPRDVQLQVFQRSFSTKGAGRGLGTYSIRLLSERYLGGRVRFTSTPDAGTTFYAWYPLELAEKQADPGEVVG